MPFGRVMIGKSFLLLGIFHGILLSYDRPMNGFLLNIGHAENCGFAVLRQATYRFCCFTANQTYTSSMELPWSCCSTADLIISGSFLFFFFLFFSIVLYYFLASKNVLLCFLSLFILHLALPVLSNHMILIIWRLSNE